MATKVLNVKGLSKKYGTLNAVQDLSFSVKKGQVYGILGPNGSGKTTTLGMLLGVIQPNSGTFSWFENGQKDSNRKNIGVLLETPNFYNYLNAYDNLKIVAKIKEIPTPTERIEEVLTLVNLKKRGKKPFKTFSLGMKQRLAIASALLSDPEVLVLDEPTNGLDPQGIVEIRTLIQNIAKEGKTIIIASHILDEIEKICSHVAIIKDGRILQEGALDEILTDEKLVFVGAENMEELEKAIQANPIFRKIRKMEDANLILIAAEGQISNAAINRQFAEQNIFLNHLAAYRKNLESTFLEIISK